MKNSRAAIREKKVGGWQNITTAFFINASVNSIMRSGSSFMIGSILHWPQAYFPPNRNSRWMTFRPHPHFTTALLLHTSQWWLLPIDTYHAAFSLLVSPAQEAKGCSDLFRHQQQPHSGHGRWKANTLLSLGFVSLGCSGRCLAMADTPAYPHGCGPVSVGS